VDRRTGFLEASRYRLHCRRRAMDRSRTPLKRCNQIVDRRTGFLEASSFHLRVSSSGARRPRNKLDCSNGIVLTRN